jgi:hypothetical protein
MKVGGVVRACCRYLLAPRPRPDVWRLVNAAESWGVPKASAPAQVRLP